MSILGRRCWGRNLRVSVCQPWQEKRRPAVSGHLQYTPSAYQNLPSSSHYNSLHFLTTFNLSFYLHVEPILLQPPWIRLRTHDYHGKRFTNSEEKALNNSAVERSDGYWRFETDIYLKPLLIVSETISSYLQKWEGAKLWGRVHHCVICWLDG
jgi:hypothetical protein